MTTTITATTSQSQPGIGPCFCIWAMYIESPTRPRVRRLAIQYSGERSKPARPFPWEFHRSGQVIATNVSSRIVIDDPSAALAACEAGLGLFQSFELGLAPWLTDGRLTQVLAEWSEETFPLYVLYPSR